jgi:hypothetical protein
MATASKIHNSASSYTGNITTSFTDTTAAIGSTYEYELLPYDMVDGNPVTAAATLPQTITMPGVITATPATDPVVVNSTAATNNGLTQVSISLPFTDSNPSATDTAVVDWGDGRSGSPDTSAGTITESADSGTVAGTHDYPDGTYTATVTITNSDGNSTPTPVEIEVGGLPSAPTDAFATVTGGNVSVGWSASPSASGFTPTGYNIYGTILPAGTTAPASDATWTLLDSVERMKRGRI